MLKITRTFLITSLCFNTLAIIASQPHIIETPGLLGGRSDTIIDLFYATTKWNTDTLPISEKPDLGQKRCLEHFKKRINSYSEAAQKNPILIATAEATATHTLYISEITDASKLPSAFICEGYAASFNQCIPHVVENLVPLTQWLPLKDYWLPHAAPYLPYAHGTWFPLWHYDPTEKQAIELLELLPKDLLTIIVHCKQDRLTPYEGAVAAYQKLRDTDHDNTYLISVDIDQNCLLPNNLDRGHINVLSNSTNGKNSIFSELLKYLDAKKIDSDTNFDLDAVQPNPDDETNKAILKQFENKEKDVKRFGSFLSLSKLIISLCILYRLSIPVIDYIHYIQSSV